MSFGKDDTQTTTQEVKFPKYVEEAQKTLAQGATKGLKPYLDAPEAFVAPLNPNQQRIGTAAGGLLDFAQGTQGLGQLADYAPQFMAQMGGMDQFIPGYSQQAIDASTIDMNDIQAFANPYAEGVLDTGMRRLDEAYNASQNDIGARAAAAGAFGGSREAVQRNMLDEDRMNAASDMASQIAYDSYGIGAQLAGQNAAAQTAALQAAGNDVYGRALGANQMDLSALGSAANYGLSRGNFMNQAAGDYLNRNMSAAGLLGGYGDLERAYAQQMGDRNWTQFGRLAGYIPGIQGSQQTTQPVNNTGLLGTAMTAASLFL